MPTLYEYFGIYIYFFSNDHLPVHIHVRSQTGSCKVIFAVEYGKILRYDIYQIGKKKMPSTSDIKKLKELLSHHGNDVIKKWREFYIDRKIISPVRITKRLK